MNDIVIAFLTVFFGFCIFILCRAITVITHEIGHAIPALLFTLKPVNIYIGSYGQDKGMMKLSLRKNLTLNIKNNPLTWQSGMVEHFPENISFTKKFLITILGPLMSLIIALVGLWLCFNFDLHGFLKLFTIIFCLSALFDLRNIYPSDEPILLNDGSTVYCDGYKLKLLLQERKQNAIFKNGLKLLNENKNDSAYALFKTIPTNKFNYLTSTVIFSEPDNFQQRKNFVIS